MAERGPRPSAGGLRKKRPGGSLGKWRRKRGALRIGVRITAGRGGLLRALAGNRPLVDGGGRDRRPIGGAGGRQSKDDAEESQAQREEQDEGPGEELARRLHFGVSLPGPAESLISVGVPSGITSWIALFRNRIRTSLSRSTWRITSRSSCFTSLTTLPTIPAVVTT